MKKMSKQLPKTITITATGYYNRLHDKRLFFLEKDCSHDVKRFAKDSEQRDSYIIEVWRAGGPFTGGAMVDVMVEMENCK